MAASRRKGTVGGKRPGAGRPALPPRERRRHVVMLRLSDEELEAVQQGAGEEPLATYVRRVAVDAARNRRRDRKERT